MPNESAARETGREIDGRGEEAKVERGKELSVSLPVFSAGEFGRT